MLTVLLAWLFADFLTGIIHWLQDKHLSENPKYSWLTEISADNQIHHKSPGLFTTYSVWDNIGTSVMVSLPLSLMLFFIGSPTIIWLGVFFASFGNLIHRWSHMHSSKLNRFIRFMQWTGLFISIEHHRQHHFKNGVIITRQESFDKYCPMTIYLNPVLDKINFFRAKEQNGNQ